jgi:hypothetical protein
LTPCSLTRPSDRVNGIAVDALGNAYVAGVTFSNDFLMQGAFQPAFGGSDDAFVTKFNAAGSALVYSTHLGGNNFGQANDIALNSFGNAYVTGQTTSTNFPVTTGAFQTTAHGSGDIFVTKLSQFGSCNALAYAASTGSPFAAGTGLASMAVGDFDRDGKQDLATANQFSDNVSILLRQCPPPTTFTWNGSASTDWFTGANWDMGTMPGATDIVIIPSTGVANEPTISGADATVRSTTVQTGHMLTLSGNRRLTAATLTVDTGATLVKPLPRVTAAVSSETTLSYNPSSRSLHLLSWVSLMKYNSAPFKWRHYPPEVLMLCVPVR